MVEPKDVLKILNENERLDLVAKLMSDIRPAWRHPINVVVNGKYHKCVICGGDIGEEVFVAIKRARGGDTIRVFDKQACFNSYHWGKAEVG